MTRTRRDILISLCASGAFWGAIIGTVLGFIAGLSISVLARLPMIPTLIYGGFCYSAVCGLFPSLIVGAINGLICGMVTITYDDPLGDAPDYKNTILNTSLTVASVLGASAAFLTLVMGNGSAFQVSLVAFAFLMLLCGLSSVKITQDHLGDLRKEEAEAHEPA